LYHVPSSIRSATHVILSLAGDGRRRKALLISCNYPGTSAALSGCCNDAVCMEYLLKNKARALACFTWHC
jgi:Caspase domain